jgi:hypothetical protein
MKVSQSVDRRSMYMLYRRVGGKVELVYVMPQYLAFRSTDEVGMTWVLHALNVMNGQEEALHLSNILMTNVPPDHPSRCDKDKWEQMQAAFERQSIEQVQDLPSGGKYPVFPELRSLLHEIEGVPQDQIEALMVKIMAREAYGINKYKQTLMTHDGRDNLKDCEDELLDLMVYLVKGWMEGVEPDAIERIAQTLGALTRLLVMKPPYHPEEEK